MSASIVIERAVVLPKLFDAGVDIARCNFAFGSARYELPASDWVFNTFAHDWIEFRQGYFPTGYDQDVTACRHYAWECASFMWREWAKTEGRTPGAGVFFGPFWFTLTNGVQHAICAFMQFDMSTTDQSKQMPLRWFDPQWSPESFQPNLTPEEVRSCEFIAGS